ncbi:hypothetical protein JCM19037_4744 [Geomicrobium sp. JCM 19037]|uniref:GNAT family N-acetyltransferase n=1 Tax=Geomicrobium sp. JCM 19037 TaxID=1460634 RepID=UPI00045F0FEE|nr:GNAT family N-acetyltransferase [Geomicrobium sp. JCM 19037]GAK06167.1 hypothetical protein JCM19037_4744 [Geomicrobium sp. JCM 19037]
MLNLRRYGKQDENDLFQLIESEGEEWNDYLTEEGRENYKKTLAGSLTLLAYEGEELCGYSRSIVDGEFHVYVCDLLVHQEKRGNGYGEKLMAAIYEKYPNHTVFVMSDVDEYYEKLGYRKEGTVFEVNPPSSS